EHWRVATRAHRHDDGRTVDDRREDECRELGIVYDVDGQATRLRRSRHGGIHLTRVGCRDDERRAIEVMRLKLERDIVELATGCERTEFLVQLRRDHGDARAGFQQQIDFAKRYVSAADDD